MRFICVIILMEIAEGDGGLGVENPSEKGEKYVLRTGGGGETSAVVEGERGGGGGMRESGVAAEGG